MLHENDRAMKDAYRAQKGLLTSEEIVMIRKKYDIKQTDLINEKTIIYPFNFKLDGNSENISLYGKEKS